MENRRNCKLLTISVRGLIVLVLVIGVGFGWLVHTARIQRDAVAAIKKAGGTVYYDWEWNKGTPNPSARPWAPAWLYGPIGLDYFGHVVAVRGHASMTQSDAVMAAIGRQRRIQYLGLDHWYMNDAELAQLKRLTNPQQLSAPNGQISDAEARLDGLLELGPFREVGTQVSDHWLVYLKGLEELSDLSVCGTQITDAGLLELKGLPQLSGLFLYETRVTDAGVRELQKALPGLWIFR